MKCQIIAECGWNHLGDMSLAEKMIYAAKDAGVDYVKFQTWKVSRLKPGPWDNDGRREIYKKAELSNGNHKYLQSICERAGVKFLTSCFCIKDIDFIRSICDEIKIPSTECVNEELITAATDKFTKVFISTGATKFNEYIRWAYCHNVWLLHCVSSYPCLPDKINLAKMYAIASVTPRYGYSGHYDGIWDAIVAMTNGATVIEKHFTLDKSLPGRDNQFAILPEQMKQICIYRDILPVMLKDHG